MIPDGAGIDDGVKWNSGIVSNTKILLLSEDDASLAAFSDYLLDIGYRLEKTDSSINAGTLLDTGTVDIFITDLYLSDEDPFEIASNARRLNPVMESIGLCYIDDFDKMLECGKKGFVSILPRNLSEMETYGEVVYSLAQRVAEAKNISMRMKEAEGAMAVAAILAAPHFSFEEKLKRCLRVVLGHLDAERGSIQLIDSNTNEIVMMASTQDNLIGLRKSLDETSVASWVVKNMKPLNVNDIDEIEEFHFSKSGKYSGDAFLTFPILFDEKSLGVLNVTDKSSGSFSDQDEVAVSRFLGRLGAVIENASLTEEIKKEREKLSIAHQELKKLEEIRENLVSMLVHDLKTPIGEITANLSMLTGENLEDFEKETILLAKVGTENLLSMVMDILDVNRMEEGKFTLSLGTVDIEEIAVNKIEQVKALLEMDNKLIILEKDGSDFKVNADNGIVTRILANLVTNAINYSPENGRVLISLKNIENGMVRVGVQDDGPGVPDEFKDIIFMKFGQVNKDNKRHKYSTGLGLTFCKMAIDAHGGDIWVDKVEEGGSIFYFTLPKLIS